MELNSISRVIRSNLSYTITTINSIIRISTIATRINFIITKSTIIINFIIRISTITTRINFIITKSTIIIRLSAIINSIDSTKFCHLADFSSVIGMQPFLRFDVNAIFEEFRCLGTCFEDLIFFFSEPSKSRIRDTRTLFAQKFFSETNFLKLLKSLASGKCSEKTPKRCS
jgi:hypothetical protein